jgi:hypothetical protein
MSNMRYMNWAARGEGVEVDNAGDLARGAQRDLRRLAARTGASIEVVLGRGGSGRNLFVCLPAIEGRGILTILGFNALTVEDLRDWSRNFSFQADIMATPSDVARETSHLVLISDFPGERLFDGLEYLPEMPNLEQITLVPPFDQSRGLEVPDWIDECTYLESVRSDPDTVTWTIITTKSFPERTTRTTNAGALNSGIQHWRPPRFTRNLNEGSQARPDNWSWSDFSDVADCLVRSEVCHPNAFDDSHFINTDGHLPSLAAAVEREVNERAFGMWGEPTTPEVMFVRASAYSRPLMILARILTPLALRCSQTGEKPELRTLFGVGEFLYPRVLAAVEKRLAAESSTGDLAHSD